MNFDFPHGFSRQDARARLEALGDYLNNRHGIKVTWRGDTASFSGKYLVVSISGEMTLDERAVKVTGKDPGMLWRKKAVDYLRGKLETYLDPQTPLERLARG
jgi:hypothetical protein